MPPLQFKFTLWTVKMIEKIIYIDFLKMILKMLEGGIRGGELLVSRTRNPYR